MLGGDVLGHAPHCHRRRIDGELAVNGARRLEKIVEKPPQLPRLPCDALE
jgi:hypothetical protein